MFSVEPQTVLVLEYHIYVQIYIGDTLTKESQTKLAHTAEF